jgi:hypothetical protein
MGVWVTTDVYINMVQLYNWLIIEFSKDRVTKTGCMLYPHVITYTGGGKKSTTV